MKLNGPNPDLFIPDGTEASAAIERTTHLGIGAHQDDLEFMAFHGILECFHTAEAWFGGVTCTNGAGSARTGKYERLSDAQMQDVRKQEQKDAASVGHYSFMAQLDYPSSEIKFKTCKNLLDDLDAILAATRPEVVYTHNPADKHDTHIAVVIPVIQAIRQRPKDERPKKVYGCEVWRGLDWMQDEDKVPLKVDEHENLAAALGGIFDSQIAGGKRYDLATLGRRRANATFFDSHATDEAEQIWFAMDLTPLTQDENLDIVQYVQTYLDRFTNDVNTKLKRQIG